MEKENELYDVSVIKPEYLVEPFEDNSPIYLCITEEQLVLLMWLENHGFLEFLKFIKSKLLVPSGSSS